MLNVKMSPQESDIGEEILVGEQAPRPDQDDVLQHALAIQSPQHFAAQFKLLASHAAPSAETESACSLRAAVPGTARLCFACS